MFIFGKLSRPFIVHDEEYGDYVAPPRPKQLPTPLEIRVHELARALGQGRREIRGAKDDARRNGELLIRRATEQASSLAQIAHHEGEDRNCRLSARIASELNDAVKQNASTSVAVAMAAHFGVPVESFAIILLRPVSEISFRSGWPSAFNLQVATVYSAPRGLEIKDPVEALSVVPRIETPDGIAVDPYQLDRDLYMRFAAEAGNGGEFVDESWVLLARHGINADGRMRIAKHTGGGAISDHYAETNSSIATLRPAVVETLSIPFRTTGIPH